MKTRNLLLAAVVSTGLAFSLTAQAGEHKSELVDQKTLSAAVQKTITERAAGGEIVRVHREDDKNGRWNYEVVVKTDGKEWGFEVDPNGKFVKSTTTTRRRTNTRLDCHGFGALVCSRT